MSKRDPDSEWAMIESIEFTNFKALRKTKLQLAPFTLLLGPNGSGKSTVLQGLNCIGAMSADGIGNPASAAARLGMTQPSLLSITAGKRDAPVEIKVRLRLNNQHFVAIFHWLPTGRLVADFTHEGGAALQQHELMPCKQWLGRIQTFSLNADEIGKPVQVNSGPLKMDGAGLAAVLDDVKDNHQERWDSLLAELREWLPEFDSIQFDKPLAGQKAIVLRTKTGGHRIPAKDLSQGTLIALALLTLAYSPNPPSVIGLEEIDRGLHPRLLRHLQDALYRLSYPESCGEQLCPPIQVIATTHSPYLLDLYREHPEEVVLAQKKGLEVEMHCLKDIEHFEEILGDSPLSDVWYSGVLGGVAVNP